MTCVNPVYSTNVTVVPFLNIAASTAPDIQQRVRCERVLLQQPSFPGVVHQLELVQNTLCPLPTRLMCDPVVMLGNPAHWEIIVLICCSDIDPNSLVLITPYPVHHAGHHQRMTADRGSAQKLVLERLGRHQFDEYTRVLLHFRDDNVRPQISIAMDR